MEIDPNDLELEQSQFDEALVKEQEQEQEPEPEPTPEPEQDATGDHYPGVAK